MKFDTCLVALLLITLVYSQKPWVPSAKYNDSYIAVNIATDIDVILPVIEKYPLDYQVPDSPIIDVCSNTNLNIRDRNCTDFFCRNETSYEDIHNFINKDDRRDYQNLWIYCTYCERPTFLSFRDDVVNGKCRYYLRPPRENETYFGQCGKSGKMVFLERNIGDVMTVYNETKFSWSPFGCFCDSDNRIQFKCDGFVQWATFRIYVHPIVHASIMAVLFLITFLLSTVPNLLKSYRVAKKISGKGFKLVRDRVNIYLNFRMQSSVFLLLSALFYIGEHIFTVVVSFHGWENLRQETKFGGLIRMMAIVWLMCGFSCLMVLWMHLCSDTKMNLYTGVRGKSGWTLIGFYALLIVASTTSYIMFFTYDTNPSFSFAIMGFFVLLYVLFFPISFLVYGLQLYRKLTKLPPNDEIARITRSKAEFTQYMLVTIFVFFICFTIGTLVTVGYAIGWDYLGPWLGAVRNFCLDFTATLMYLCLMYMSVDKTLLNKAYPCFRACYNWLGRSRGPNTELFTPVE